jgi:uncharacterized membrane protein YjgN (DUF898 family)
MTMSTSPFYSEPDFSEPEDINPAEPAVISQTCQPNTFNFTGNGAEYFRIWIVNLCLTLATLGIYSAWAKVRRLQYFDRNTELNGAVFNFHGNPVAIFKGRLLALLLLIAYHYAFGFSKPFGIIVITALFLTLPWMLRSALRFRLRNTSYRGVRFNFGGGLPGAYFSYTPMLALFLVPVTTAALFPTNQFLLGLEFVILYLSWPVIHAAMKRYQQSYIEYGNQPSTYSATTFNLVIPYLLASAIGLGLILALVILAGVLTFIEHSAIRVMNNGADLNPGLNTGGAIGILLVVLYVYGLYLIAGPFLQVKIWNLVWNNTRFPEFTIRSELEFWPYLGLQTMNLLLTLLTLGLYRPFAVVRTYGYRLSRMSVIGSEFDPILQSKQNQQIAASGDSSADLFGIDLSF